MNQEVNLTDIQRFCCWLVDRGEASRLEVYNYAAEAFGEDKVDFLLMWALQSGSVYCVDNKYIPTEELRKVVVLDKEHRPQAHRDH